MSVYTAGDSKVVLTELEHAVAEGAPLYGTPGSLFWRSIASIRQEIEHNHTGNSWPNAATVTQAALAAYWESLQRTFGAGLSFSRFENIENAAQTLVKGDAVALTLARGLGRYAAQFEPLIAGYWLGEVYTQLLPPNRRAQFGVYYTPPALTQRLLASLQNTGVEWSSVRVIDPACGGGAFLSPVGLQMVKALESRPAREVIDHIAKHLHGFELDAFGAWMSQVLLEASLYPVCLEAGERLPAIVETCDALEHSGNLPAYDIVIGNPPYGRMVLPPHLRARFGRSVYGHANLYGLFMDLAIRLATPQGLIAYVTPTSFLGGQYFRNLRALLSEQAPPVAINLVSSRKGVFTDVLQETLLAIYQRGATGGRANVSVVELVSESELAVQDAGAFTLPQEPHSPWLLPRASTHRALIDQLRQMPHRLRDYGYKVSTGPLVWNRYKSQLVDAKGDRTYPIVWAESVTRDGRFVYSANKKNHKPFLWVKDGDEWLITDQPCILVQRTTAKEQHRRLIAAELPVQFLRQHSGISVENHLNMVRPIVEQPTVTMRTVAALLNSEIVDQVFRCISGSVAVSASELEALPLPAPNQLGTLEDLLAHSAPKETIERAIAALYMMEASYVPA